jgi:hypothetical protein
MITLGAGTLQRRARNHYCRVVWCARRYCSEEAVAICDPCKAVGMATDRDCLPTYTGSTATRDVGVLGSLAELEGYSCCCNI